MAININSNTGNITAGGDNTDGDLLLNANDGTRRIHLDAGSGNALLGGNGADLLFGSFASDTFIHRPFHDDDIIADFETAFDFVDLTSHNFANFEQVEALLSDIGGDAFLNLQGADSITFTGVASAELQEENFLL